MSEVCERCGGVGFIPTYVKEKRKRWEGKQLVEVEYDAPAGVINCDCRHRAISDYLLRKSGLPAMHASSSFGNYIPESPSQQLAWRAAMDFTDNWNSETTKSLLFWGGCGVGKTHLLVAIAREMTKMHHISTAFVDFRDFLDRRRREFGTGSADLETERILSVDLLLLDELGAARQTDFSAEVVSTIINERYNRRKPVVITTNFSFLPSMKSEIETDGNPYNRNNYVNARTKETLGDRVGSRSFSRLNEMCRVLRMDGRDYRMNGGQR
jgi:DNA replication protein DnaC